MGLELILPFLPCRKAAETEAGPGAPLGSLPLVTHGLHSALPMPLPSSGSVGVGVGFLGNGDGHSCSKLAQGIFGSSSALQAALGG